MPAIYTSTYSGFININRYNSELLLPRLY